MMKDAIVIINPTAGKADSQAFVDNIKDKLQTSFASVVIRETAEAGDATQFASDACAAGVSAIFAVGGDGTVNEVIKGMRDFETRPILGIFPAGTYNALARELNVPMNINQAVDNFSTDNIKTIDIGKVNDDVFGCVLSIGDISEGIHNVESEEKTRFGILAYLRSVTAHLSEANIYDLELVVDGEAVDLAVSHLFVLMSNGFGPIQVVDSDKGASMGDGHMNVVAVKAGHPFEMMSLLPDILAGDIVDNENIYYAKAKELTVTSSKEVVTDIEGDKGPKLPIKVTVLDPPFKAFVY